MPKYLFDYVYKNGEMKGRLSSHRQIDKTIRQLLDLQTESDGTFIRHVTVEFGGGDKIVYYREG